MIWKIQNAFTKHIKGFSSFSYQEQLSNLKIYSLQRRRERYIIIYVWKILENLVPNLVKPLQFYVSHRRGRLCSVSVLQYIALVAEWLRVRLRVRMVKGSTLTVGNFLSLENLNVIIRAIN